MAYYVRLMRREDVAQVAQIDREAFPTLWPPPNYRRELNNRLARYIVTCDSEKTVEPPEANAAPEKRGIPGLIFKLRQLFDYDRFSGDKQLPASREYVMGFAGIWTMSDEVHITSIAVRQSYLGRGIGELLLLSLINLAMELNTRTITLEVRVSNTAAQSLYRKYGFTEVGVRRAYYSDNREDGLLMSTEDISSAEFQAHLKQLKKVHSQKCEAALYQITS